MIWCDILWWQFVKISSSSGWRIRKSFPFHLPSYYYSEDTRPGLVPKHIARQHKQQAKQKELNEFNKIKPKKVLEKEKREEGLSKTIGAENKGFAMLQKMGFKPGMTLGKKGNWSSFWFYFNFGTFKIS